MITAFLLMQWGGALALQLLGIGLVYFLFINAVPLFVAMLLDALLNRGARVISLWMYVLGMFVPLLTGMKTACITLDAFAPLVCSLHSPCLSQCAHGNSCIMIIDLIF